MKKKILIGIIILCAIVVLFLFYNNRTQKTLATSSAKPTHTQALSTNSTSSKVETKTLSSSTKDAPNDSTKDIHNTTVDSNSHQSEASKEPVKTVTKPEVHSTNTSALKTELLSDLNIANQKVTALNNSPNASKTSYSIVSTEKDIYNIWNDQINSIYQKVMAVLPKDKQIELQDSEVSWINQKKSTSSQFASKSTPGTLGYGMRYLSKESEMTKARCFYIIDNYLA